MHYILFRVMTETPARVNEHLKAQNKAYRL